MAQSAKLYGPVFTSAFTGKINVPTGTFKALLTSSAYTPNQDTDQFLSSVTSELTGGGYARVTLASVAIAYDAATNVFSMTCASFSFAAMSGTYRYLPIVLDTGVAATSPLIGWLDFGADVIAATQTVDITVPSEGLFAVDIP